MIGLTLTGTDLTDARAIATWAVLDAAGSHVTDDPTDDTPRLLAEREQLRRALGHDYDHEAIVTGHERAQLGDLARECEAEALDLLADGAGHHGPRYDEHYRAQRERAQRVARLLA